MSWNTAPILAVGSIVTATYWNDIAADVNILATYLPTFGVGSPIAGSALPSAGSPGLLLQAGVLTATASTGGFSFSYPNAFPNGVLAVSVQPLNASYGNDTITVEQSGTNVSGITGWYSRSGSSFSGSIAVTYIAIGF